VKNTYSPETTMIVREIMTPEPYAVNVSSNVRQVLRMLAEADVRHLPVVEEGSLVGIVSDRDLRSLGPIGPEVFEQRGATREALAQPVTEIMSSDIVTVTPENDVAEVIDLMIEHRIGAVPVVEAGSTRLVGIVSYVDALRAARDLV
jgi:CBS domain-containing protein